MTNGDFIDCVLIIADEMTKENLELFAIMCWAMWVELCRRYHSSNIVQKHLDIDWALSYLDSFKGSVGIFSPVNNSCQNNSSMVWKAPVVSHLRVDVDAGFSEANNLSAGSVIRDHWGQVLGAKAMLLRNPGSVLRGELMAIRLGLDLCYALRLSDVCLFSDSYLAVQGVIHGDTDCGVDGPLILEVRDLITELGVLSIQHMKRTANDVAHCLVKHVLLSKSDTDWSNDNIPTWFSDIVLRY